MDDPEDGRFNLQPATEVPDSAQRKERAGLVHSLLTKVDSTRCASFTASAVNPLLWAHYAGGFTGVALEYELPNDSPSLMVLPIIYDEAPVLSNDDCRAILDGSAMLWDRGILLTKRPVWRYEEEYRAFWLVGTQYMDRVRPLSVVIGARNIPELHLLEQIAHKYELPVRHLKWDASGYVVEY